MRALFGVDYISGGDIYVDGKKVRINNPRDAKKEGLAFITEDRKVEGLTLDYSVLRNIEMANLDVCEKGGFLNRKLENKLADKYIRLVNIKTPSRNQKVLYLSGGNQQKVVVAKWMNADSDIIIMDEPTRGIDAVSYTHLDVYKRQILTCFLQKTTWPYHIIA